MTYNPDMTELISLICSSDQEVTAHIASVIQEHISGFKKTLNDYTCLPVKDAK